MKRREFLQIGSVALAGLAATGLAPGGLTLAAPSATPDGYPLDLATLACRDLRFGTGIYAYRSGVDLPWVLDEARALGLTGARVEYSRSRVEASRDDSVYDPANYSEPHQEATRMLKQSGLEILFTLDGHKVDARRKPVDFPRNPDGTVNGRAAAPGFANFVRFALEHTHAAAGAYELWNEAFNTNFDKNFADKGFGPGGSKQNADNYAAMMLPALRLIKSRDRSMPVLIEGNYWNAERSSLASPGYLELAREADFAVLHPYGYKLRFYEAGAPGERGGTIHEVRNALAGVNPHLGLWFTEYNVSAKNMGLEGKVAPPEVQAKAVLRATLLHLSHGVKRMDVFDMYYPSIPGFTLIDQDRSRRPAWFALKRLLAALTPGKQGRNVVLDRKSALPRDVRDLAVATPSGASYLIWQETPVESFPRAVPPTPVTVTLAQSQGKPLRLVKVVDPVTGSEPRELKSRTEGGRITLALAVPDYPLVCLLEG